MKPRAGRRRSRNSSRSMESEDHHPGAVLAEAGAAPARRHLRNPHLHDAARRAAGRDRAMGRADRGRGPSCRRWRSAAIPRSAGSTSGSTSGPTRMPPSASRSATRRAQAGVWPPKGGTPASPQAGEHAGRPGGVLAAQVAHGFGEIARRIRSSQGPPSWLSLRAQRSNLAGALRSKPRRRWRGGAAGGRPARRPASPRPPARRGCRRRGRGGPWC